MLVCLAGLIISCVVLLLDCLACGNDLHGSYNRLTQKVYSREQSLSIVERGGG